MHIIPDFFSKMGYFAWKTTKEVFLIVFDGFWSKYDEFRPNQNFEISATFDLIFDPQDDVIEKGGPNLTCDLHLPYYDCI